VRYHRLGPSLLLIFAVLTVAATLGLLRALDAWTAIAVRGLWTEALAWAWAVLYVAGSALISLLILLVVLAALWRRNARLAGALLIAFLIASVVEVALKHWLSQPSPPVVAGMISVQLPEDSIRDAIFGRMGMLDATGNTVNSYPSGHMIRTLLVLVAIVAIWPRQAVRRGAIVAGIAAAVILVGARVHWLSDVAGGALLAGGLATTALAFAGRQAPGPLQRGIRNAALNKE
jgi:membrane-associated phospholipid phosphatase